MNARAADESARPNPTKKGQTLRDTQERLREALARLDAQIREIAGLHASYLPARFPSVGGLSFAALCRPCAEIAGDYYDVFPMPNGRVCLLIADVTGHGVRAAVSMAVTRSLIRVAASQAQPADGPGALLSRVNAWLCDQLVDSQFVTMWLGLWDPAHAQLRFARAGHPAGILCRAGRDPQPLSADGVPPLGILPHKQPPPEATLHLDPFDRLFLYTDGLTEAATAEGAILGVQGLLNAIEETDGLALESVPLSLYHQLERHAANAALRDDVSVLILERRPDAQA